MKLRPLWFRYESNPNRAGAAHEAAAGAAGFPFFGPDMIRTASGVIDPVPECIGRTGMQAGLAGAAVAGACGFRRRGQFQMLAECECPPAGIPEPVIGVHMQSDR